MIKKILPGSLKRLLKDVLGLTRLELQNTALAERCSELTREIAETKRMTNELAKLQSRVPSLSESLVGIIDRMDTISRLRDDISRVDRELQNFLPILCEIRTNIIPWQMGQWAKQQFNTYESTVNLALRDLIKPGDIVFDCGSNIGLLSVLMSRLVGPKGYVCSFEASPRNIEACNQNLLVNACHNLTLYHAAICSDTGKTILFELGDHDHADRIIPNNEIGSRSTVLVPALSLDDYVKWSGLVPSVVKMDIEGAEYSALCGFRKTLRDAKPHIILETTVNDLSPADLLRDLGYRILDLSTYREVHSSVDFDNGIHVVNLLGIHESRFDGLPYQLPIPHRTVYQLHTDNFSQKDHHCIESTKFELPAGRYIVFLDASATGTDNMTDFSIRDDNICYVQYCASTSWVLKSYRNWVLDLSSPTKLNLVFKHLSGRPDMSFKIHAATIRELLPFSSIERRWIF